MASLCDVQAEERVTPLTAALESPASLRTAVFCAVFPGNKARRVVDRYPVSLLVL